MFFQTAGIEIQPWIPPLVAFGISFLTSMGGVSGAFLLLPFQMSFLGYTSPSVSATNQLFNIVAIPSGVYRYWQEGRMIWPLVGIVTGGTLPGVLIGAIVRVNYLPDPKQFKVFAAAVLLYIGMRMIHDLLRKNTGVPTRDQGEKHFQERMKGSQTGIRIESQSAVKLTHFNFRRFGYTFYDEQFDVSTGGIFSLSLIVGVIGGIYGIGGGAIIAPFFVTFFHLPVYTVAGAALMGTFVTSVAGVVFYQAIAQFYSNISIAPDWLLGILFGIGGMVGMYFGARCQKYVPAKVIKWMLSVIILFTALKYAIDALI
jgi:hypothetical protein